MKISVITVSFNAHDEIERTILSVIGQDYDDYEYVIVDGGSTDGTVDLIKKHSSKISKWISEPDSGIYCAMNKAVSIASGDYCIFMNAGDCFVSPNVLKKVSRYLDGTVGYVLGNQIHVATDGRICAYTISRQKISRNNLLISSIAHQASFILRSLLVSDPYDETLKLVSDWKFALEKLVFEGVSYRCIDVDVCFFFRGGATDSMRRLGQLERRTVLSGHFSQDEIADMENMAVHGCLLLALLEKIRMIIWKFSCRRY